MITDDNCWPGLLLMYFIGAATDTTMLSPGKVSIRAARRLSYSSAGIPGVSSFGFTTHKVFLYVSFLTKHVLDWTNRDVGATEKRVDRIMTVSLR
jgi:hypothetical protein